MDKIKWCLEKGMKLIEPNEKLAREYFTKARRSLLMLNKNTPDEWKVISAYYAMYDASTGLLEKIGVRSEIHSCTIEVLKLLLPEADILENAKEARIDCQYKIVKPEKLKEYLKIVSKANKFVNTCTHLALSMTDKDIEQIRHQIR